MSNRFILVFIILVSILSNCTSKKVSKKLFLEQVLQEENTIVEQVMDKNPELIYCFKKDKQKLREDLKLAFRLCWEKAFVDKHQLSGGYEEGYAMGQKVGLCSRHHYLVQNKKFYNILELKEKQSENCLELKLETQQIKNWSK